MNNYNIFNLIASDYENPEQRDYENIQHPLQTRRRRRRCDPVGQVTDFQRNSKPAIAAGVNFGKNTPKTVNTGFKLELVFLGRSESKSVCNTKKCSSPKKKGSKKIS